MRRPALIRRREVWLPTVWGWLALALAAAAAAHFGLTHVFAFLAPTRPVGARLLVVEGWMPPAELNQAVALYGRGGYERALTTGGPIENEFESAGYATYAERARAYLLAHGLPGGAVIALPAPPSRQDRTFLNAVMVREWLARSAPEIDALDVISSGPHSRRSWRLHALALGPRIRVGVIAAAPGTYDGAVWWQTSAGAREVLVEGIAWLWTELVFHPPAPGSNEEMWGKPKR